LRIDVFLHKVCLMKSRSMAGEACRREKVRLNGEPARASRSVEAGATILLDLASGLLEIEVTQVPPGSVPRRDALNYYRIVRDERGADPLL
jgi:ribosomal 50S subunit-recycling heat shock protein